MYKRRRRAQPVLPTYSAEVDYSKQQSLRTAGRQVISTDGVADTIRTDVCDGGL